MMRRQRSWYAAHLRLIFTGIAGRSINTLSGLHFQVGLLGRFEAADGSLPGLRAAARCDEPRLQPQKAAPRAKREGQSKTSAWDKLPQGYQSVLRATPDGSRRGTVGPAYATGSSARAGGMEPREVGMAAGFDRKHQKLRRLVAVQFVQAGFESRQMSARS